MLLTRAFVVTAIPGATRAAVDTDRLGQESPADWTAVDSIHEYASEYAGTERKLPIADHHLHQVVKTRELLR